MTSIKPQSATGPEAEAAYARALPILEAAAAAAVIPTPELKIVTSISAQPGGDASAVIDFRDSQHIVVKLPLAAALETKDAGLSHLIAHEIGHVATKNSPWYRRRFLLALAGMIPLIVLLGLLVWSAVDTLVLQRQPMVQVGWLYVGVVACLFSLAGALHCSRQIEYQADAFAVQHLGSIEGARQQFTFFDERRPSRSRLHHLLYSPWSTHPSHDNRVRAMEEVIIRSNAV